MRQQERRREARIAAGSVRARVRPGHRLVVLDVSAGGALVEAMCQLRPGSRVDVHLETDDQRQMVRARVTRCAVATIDPDVGITYRAALCFTERCEWVRETTTHAGSAMPTGPGGATAVTNLSVDRLPAGDQVAMGKTARGSK
jgi:hypothetical protein